jgi:hypothetical protein
VGARKRKSTMHFHESGYVMSPELKGDELYQCFTVVGLFDDGIKL